MRHLALVRFAPSILRELLHLPDTVEIRDGEYDFRRQQFRFLIEGDELPESHEGEDLRIVDMVFEENLDGVMRFKGFTS